MSVNVAVVGATGAVGQEFLTVLAERNFPIKNLKLLASARSAGKSVAFKGQDYKIDELTKETGDVNEARRYFARGRGDKQVLSVTTVLIAATVIVSLSAILSAEGQVLYEAFQLDKQAVAAGEYWRLFTVTLLHGSPEPGFFAPSLVHLFFNMYALYLAGPIVERWYG